MNEEIQQLQNRIAALESSLSQVLKYSFSSKEVFLKSVEIRGKLKLQNLTVNPSNGEIGEMVVIAGKLKICTSPNTWVSVGSQT